MAKPIVIIGAGPAGLACAYKILRDSDKEVIIIDKALFIGGAGASFQWKGHTLDYGPHAFHSRGSEPERIVRELFIDNPDSLIEGRKHVHVYLQGKRFRYPLKVGESLLKFNPFLSLKIIIEFLLTSLLHTLVSIPVVSFEDWGRKRFGATLYKMSFGDYTEKVWKTKASLISEKFASEKIQGFSFVNIIKRLFKIGGQVTEPYYQTWIYPVHGSGKFYEKFGERIQELGGTILLGSSIESINITGASVSSVTIKRQGKSKEIPCSALVNTVPLPQFITMLPQNVPFIVRNSASKLRYTSLILVYVEFNVERVSEDHWFYLLDSKFKFNRVTEQKNLSSLTMEPGKTVLSLELTCRVGDKYWELSDKELFDLAYKDLQKIRFLRDKLPTISDFLVKKIPNVYEIYYKEFDRHAELVLDYLRQYENIVSMGRRGLFLQGDQHQAVEMGLKVADLISSDAFNEANATAFYKQYVKYIYFEQPLQP